MYVLSSHIGVANFYKVGRSVFLLLSDDEQLVAVSFQLFQKIHIA